MFYIFKKQDVNPIYMYYLNINAAVIDLGKVKSI